MIKEQVSLEIDMSDLLHKEESIKINIEGLTNPELNDQDLKLRAVLSILETVDFSVFAKAGQEDVLKELLTKINSKLLVR